MTKKKKTSRLAEALVETAGDMHKAGLLEQAGYNKITMRHLGMAAYRNLPRSRRHKSGQCANAPI